MPVVKRSTGELRQAQIFVAVLGASNYTSQKLPGCRRYLTVGSHQRAFAFLGGAPESGVDDLRSGVRLAGHLKIRQMRLTGIWIMLRHACLPHDI